MEFEFPQCYEDVSDALVAFENFVNPPKDDCGIYDGYMNDMNDDVGRIRAAGISLSSTRRIYDICFQLKRMFYFPTKFLLVWINGIIQW